MIKKIIAFQKMMFRSVLFIGNLSKQDNKFKKLSTEYIIFIIMMIISYCMELKLFSGMVGLLIILTIFLCNLYAVLHERDNFLFTLPLKRNFIISNIYIFSINLVIIAFFIPFLFILILLIGSISSPHPVFHLNAYDFSYFEIMILFFFLKLAYVNGMITILFIKKSKLRSIFYIIFTALYSSILLYFYWLLPNHDSNYIKNLMMIPNIWIYVIISICTAIVVTILGTFISISLDKNTNSSYK